MITPIMGRKLYISLPLPDSQYKLKDDNPDNGTAYYFYYSDIATIVNERKHLKFR